MDSSILFPPYLIDNCTQHSSSPLCLFALSFKVGGHPNDPVFPFISNGKWMIQWLRQPQIALVNSQKARIWPTNSSSFLHSTHLFAMLSPFLFITSSVESLFRSASQVMKPHLGTTGLFHTKELQATCGCLTLMVSQANLIENSWSPHVHLFGPALIEGGVLF